MSEAHKLTQGGCYAQLVIYSNTAHMIVILLAEDVKPFCCIVSKQLHSGWVLSPEEVMQHCYSTKTGLFAARR